MDDLSRLESMRNAPGDGGVPDGDDLSLSRAATMRGGPDGVLARIDQYELVRELGGGGFGTVYLARDTVSGVEYAVKGLPPEVKNSLEELEGIRANFRLVSRLTHTHIARAHVLHPVREVWYAEESVRQKLRVMPGEMLLVMEYAPGVTLSKWRRQFPGGKVPPGQALEIARQVASALDYAHEQRVIHRDVKPSNVVVETRPDGRLVARVLDFGLAAEIRSSMGRVSREVRDTSGTRPYMAPEQWLGEKQDAATDQYALAVLVHELLTGAVPFAGCFETGDPAVMMLAVTQRAPELPGDLPEAARSALARALAKKREARFPSCREFVDAAGRACPGRVEPDDAGARERPQIGGPEGGRTSASAPRKTKSKIKAIVAYCGLALFALSAITCSLSLFGRGRSEPPHASVVWDFGHKGLQLWKDGPYWAETNIGAEKPSEYGLYFWWGDTVGYRRSGGAWVASDGSSSAFSFDSDHVPTIGKSFSKLREEGWIAADGDALAPAHDAARVKWGGAWRMPTYGELKNLGEKCVWTWTRNPVAGYEVRGKGKYAANRIFLPCAGLGYGTSLYSSGSHGYYWSSVPYSDSDYAYRLNFYSGNHGTNYNYRSYGFPVRPVQGVAK